MKVDGIGEVTRVSSKIIGNKMFSYKVTYCFYQTSDGHGEDFLVADAEDLVTILVQANRNYNFYDAMNRELSQLCDKRRAEKKYRLVGGIVDAAYIAKNKAQEAKCLMEQVRDALEGIER